MYSQQESLRGSSALVLLLMAVGTCAGIPHVVVWETGDYWSTVSPCGNSEQLEDTAKLSYHVKEGGVIVTDSASNGDKVVTEFAPSGKCVCCLAENETQGEHCYHNIKHRDAPYLVGQEPPVLPMFGHHFQMKCPLESSRPGTLYYWQRYTSIDRATETGFPSDIEFSEGGRVLSTEVLTSDHNGMYECRAVNEYGEEEYVNVLDFFISVSGCAYHAPDVSVSLSPAGISTHSEGETVEIVCTAVAVDRHEQPFWYHDGPSPTPCTSPNYQLSSRFEESACQWTTVLTVPDFKNDSAGSYICSVGRHGKNIALLLEKGSSEECPNEAVGWMLVWILTTTLVAACVPAVYWCSHNTFALQPTEEPPYNGFMYDAFVSAHNEVSDFVLENLLPPLESGPSPYRLCWHSRDFIPGIPIMEQIARAMARSRRVIFVFSEHFSQSSFCSAELELAMNRYMSSCTRCILPVAIGGEHVPENVRERITYLPVLSTKEGDVAGKIAEVMGEPIPVVVERLNDSLTEE